MRHRLARLFGAAVLAMLMVLPASGIATAAEPTTATLPAIKLGCALVNPNPLGETFPNRAIVCRWVAPEGVNVAKYRLWRRVDDGPRRLLAVKRADAPLRYADFAIRTGHAYHYRVVGVGADGARVAISSAATVRVFRGPEVLRFNCFVLIDSDRRGAMCNWSDANRPAAARYVLWRSVDGGPRQAIYRVGEDGRRSFLDQDVKAGQVIRYAVVALNANGRIVGYGGPDRVVIPTWGLAAR